MKSLKLLGTMLLIGLTVGFFSKLSFAQAPPPPMMPNYAVTYFSGNSSAHPDETLRVINIGAVGDVDLPTGDICVNVYVFDAAQELQECCSCPVSANGMLTYSVQSNLTANSLTGTAPTTGVIKVTASLVPPTGCSAETPGTLPSVDVLAAWMSHLNPAPSGISVTEDELATRPLSPSEAADLIQDCSDAIELGSGKATCTCPPAA